MTVVLSGVDEVLARIDQVVRDNTGEVGTWNNHEVLELLAQLRDGLVSRPEWSQVIESNLREQVRTAEQKAQTLAVELDVERELHEQQEAGAEAKLSALKEDRLIERVQMDIAGELYRSALRQVEGERDRARAIAVRLEQELAEACRGNVRRFS